jgi:hypothetical protein
MDNLICLSTGETASGDIDNLLFLFGRSTGQLDKVTGCRCRQSDRLSTVFHSYWQHGQRLVLSTGEMTSGQWRPGQSCLYLVYPQGNYM